MSVVCKIRLVVLISGRGSNLQAILDQAASGELAAEVVAVISNRPGVYGLNGRVRRAFRRWNWITVILLIDPCLRLH